VPAFVRPLIPAIVSDIWGSDRSYRGAGKTHEGMDFQAPPGTPIYAIESGRVITSKLSGGPEGEYIKLDHGSGWESLYMHLSRRLVKTGATVSRGQKIGLSGATGIKKSMPHLHLTLKRHGRPIPGEPHIPIDDFKSPELAKLAQSRGLSIVKHAGMGLGVIALLVGVLWFISRR